MRSAIDRRLAVLEYMCERRYDTRANLMFEFGVSKNTIDRDIQALACSYPIYTTQGKGGGVHVVDGFRMNKRYMTDKQCELLKRLSENLTNEDFETMQSIINTYQKPERKNK